MILECHRVTAYLFVVVMEEGHYGLWRPRTDDDDDDDDYFRQNRVDSTSYFNDWP